MYMYMCMRVCVYGCARVYIYDACMYRYVYIHASVIMYILTCRGMPFHFLIYSFYCYLQTCTHIICVCMYVCTYLHIHTCKYIHTYIEIEVLIFVNTILKSSVSLRPSTWKSSNHGT